MLNAVRPAAQSPRLLQRNWVQFQSPSRKTRRRNQIAYDRRQHGSPLMSLSLSTAEEFLNLIVDGVKVFVIALRTDVTRHSVLCRLLRVHGTSGE